MKLANNVAWICLLLSISVWLPNFIFQEGYPFILATFVLGLAGAIFSALGRNYLLVALNIFMGLSIFIFMALGYAFGAFFG
ncbi:hypothetical protein JCM19047_4458 [Bacillus sp. JCM 19047]|nr:hypothetical protein JCM19047_4458 [Bacillus sp. JCM 19047]